MSLGGRPRQPRASRCMCGSSGGPSMSSARPMRGLSQPLTDFGVLKLFPSILRKFGVSGACLQWLARIARTMERLLGLIFGRGPVLCVSVAG